MVGGPRGDGSNCRRLSRRNPLLHQRPAKAIRRRGIIRTNRCGGKAMWRLCVLAFALLFSVGCVTEADRAQWQEALKDLRGETMKMRGLTPGTSSRPAAAKSDD